MDANELLLGNRYVAIPTPSSPTVVDNTIAVGTIAANFASYGYILDGAAMKALQGLNDAELATFWSSVKPALKVITGSNRKMGKFVVYKNFPKEVLEKSEAEYWIAQILMYWGAPNEIFTEDKKRRVKLSELPDLKVLVTGDGSTWAKIFDRLRHMTARWNDQQKAEALFIIQNYDLREASIDLYGFKENGVTAAAEVFKKEGRVSASTATDAMRLAAALSGGDVSLRTNFRFAKFKRPERQRLLQIIFEGKNILDDFALRPGQWKRLLHALRPGDYKPYRSISEAYDRLYRGDYTTFASAVEHGLQTGDLAVLDVLKGRPGEFLRRFHKTYSTFGKDAVTAFVPVMDKLTNTQLLKFDAYLSTVNDRSTFIYAPKGIWCKAQIAKNKKAPIQPADLYRLRSTVSAIVGGRLNEKFPEGFDVAENASDVTLQTNDQKLAAYGRGTEFVIPERMNFIRSASYWECKSDYRNVWFDNGWNFFDSKWSPKGTCSWSSVKDVPGSEFSGDPTNSKDLKGRACQMIDLDLTKLEQQGIRYAVWNVLCYSGIKFSDATDVLATLQWGEEAQEGKLYEPSRAQMVFPLKAPALTSYVAYIDIKRRRLVYVDANLHGMVSTAKCNEASLSKNFPAYLEYVAALPSVGDLFRHGKKGTIPVVFNDADRTITEGKAFVFDRRNEANTFEPIELTPLLG